MTKICRLIGVLFCIIALLTGCWNRREINNLVIAVGMGVDKVDKGYLVSVQVVDPGEITAQKGSGRSPVTLYKETGTTVFEAIRKMTEISARKIYFSHLRMFLIGEETANTEGIAPIVEFLFRDHELRGDYYLAITRNINAMEILKGLSAIEKIPANKMFTSLEMSSRTFAATGTLKIDELVSDLMTEGKSPAITGIRYVGDSSKAGEKKNVEVSDAYARLKYDGMAVFRRDKLVGWLNEKESKGYNYITGNVKSSVEAIACPTENGAFSVDLHRTNSKINVQQLNQNLQLDIQIEAEGSIGEVQCPIDLTNQTMILELEELTAKKIEEYAKLVLNKTESLDSDFLGLGSAIHRSNPDSWKKLKHDWADRMSSVPIKIKVTVKLRDTGKMQGSFLDKIKD